MDQRGNWHLTEALEYAHGRGDPFAAAVRATRMAMVITDPRLPDNPIVFCNKAFQDLCGYERDEIVGRNCRFLQGPGTDPLAIARVRAAIDAGLDISADLLNYRKDGSTFWNALYLSPVRDDTGKANYFFASQLDVTERVTAEQRAIARREEVEHEVALRTADLEAALAAKTVLLHELDHRVKNNLTMIGSLLRLQTRDAQDPAVAGRLEEMLQRVDALGTVHRRLYQSADVTRFDVSAFLLDLANEAVAAAAPGQLALVTDLVPITVAPGHASAFGLLLNEILAGITRHASAEARPGTVRLRTTLENGAALIEITDDGPGGAVSPGDGLGRRLIDRLSRQIGVAATWSAAAPGTCVSLSFPLASVA